MKLPTYHCLAAGVASLALVAGTAMAQITTTPEQTDPAPAPAPEQQAPPMQTAPAPAGTEKRQSVGEYTADAVITTKIKAALVAESTVSALDIKVETIDGVVHLRGDVDNDAQSATAERIARDTDNVKRVVNELRVEPLPK